MPSLTSIRDHVNFLWVYLISWDILVYVTCVSDRSAVNMSASSHQTPVRYESNKLSRPFSWDALRDHIQDAINREEFVFFDSDPNLELKLKLDEPTTAKCAKHITAIQAVVKPEREMYIPLTKLLTEISRFISSMNVTDHWTSALSEKSLIMFIPCGDTIQEDDGEAIRQDFVGVEATTVKIRTNDSSYDIHWISHWHKTQLMSILCGCVYSESLSTVQYSWTHTIWVHII